MTKTEKIALAAMTTGFIALVTGVAILSVAYAAIIAGVLLIAFGIAADRAAH